jgi:hypothetical protein
MLKSLVLAIMLRQAYFHFAPLLTLSYIKIALDDKKQAKP